jgi:hypothetical protein
MTQRSLVKAWLFCLVIGVAAGFTARLRAGEPNKRRAIAGARHHASNSDLSHGT